MGSILNLSCSPKGREATEAAATAPEETSGLNIRSATYGGNCGAAQGNVTKDLASSCNGKTDCAYKVDVDHIGDPAPKCGKDYVASYSCAPDATILNKGLPAEAGLGSILNLSCSPKGREATETAATAPEPISGLNIRSATYGGNCGAAQGNVTKDLASSCNGKTDCAYKVDVDHIGDPAPKCGKDFIASYSCAPDATVVRSDLPAEAGLGSILNLSCPPKSDGPAKQ